MNKTLIKYPEVSAAKVFDFLDVRESTREDYKSRIGLFMDFIEDKKLNRNSFLDFKRHLAEKVDYTTSTKNKYLITAKIFLKELNRQGVLPADITQNIKTFSQNKKHKKEGLNSEEMLKLTSMLKTLPDTAQNTRLKAIIALLTLQGLRQIEVSRMDVKDIDLVSKTAFIQGKGSDDKELIDLHPEAIKHLKDYLRINNLKDGALFTCQSNNHLNKRLTTRTVRKLVKNVLQELSIEKPVHGFRHFFTTTLIKTYKGDLLEVAQYTRHHSLEMLTVYNDSVKKTADLPRFYKAFSEVSF